MIALQPGNAVEDVPGRILLQSSCSSFSNFQRRVVEAVNKYL